jgi:hypothetical protein
MNPTRIALFDLADKRLASAVQSRYVSRLTDCSAAIATLPIRKRGGAERRKIARPPARRVGIGDILRQHGLPPVDPAEPAAGNGS